MKYRYKLHDIDIRIIVRSIELYTYHIDDHLKHLFYDLINDLKKKLIVKILVQKPEYNLILKNHEVFLIYVSLKYAMENLSDTSILTVFMKIDQKIHTNTNRYWNVLIASN